MQSLPCACILGASDPSFGQEILVVDVQGNDNPFGEIVDMDVLARSLGRAPIKVKPSNGTQFNAVLVTVSLLLLTLGEVVRSMATSWIFATTLPILIYFKLIAQVSKLTPPVKLAARRFAKRE